MKKSFNYNGIHTCEAVVLSCIDFRFWKSTVKFAEKELKIKSFDFPSLPGSAKAINACRTKEDLAMRCIGIPCELHNAKKIVIVNHWDCGAYGGSDKFKNSKAEEFFHKEELKKAKRKILKYYPNKEVILVLAKISDDGKNVIFSQLL